jgi:hypothetical protein
MRFLRSDECGLALAMLCFIWLALIRWAERNTSRDFFRVLSEAMPEEERLLSRLSIRYQRKWDAICPLFLQRLLFVPQWNRRSRQDLLKWTAHCRSHRLAKQQPFVKASSISLGNNVVFGDERDVDIDIEPNSLTSKATVAVAVGLGSFCCSSPHFWLNAASVFSCSIGLGMSTSLISLEAGSTRLMNSWSIVDTTIVQFVMAGSLTGQLVGSSGGVMFLAEFLFTFVSLFLGSAATLSFGSKESWGCVILLSSMAFFGFILGRGAILEGARHRRRCYASILLPRILVLLVLLWTIALAFAEWDSPVSLLVVRPDVNMRRTSKGVEQWTQASIARTLQ